MDKLTRVILNRLRQEQCRKVKRIALTNGLLDLKIVDWNGELIRRYVPAFDTSALTMIVGDDLIWFQKRFAPYLRPSDATAPSDLDARAFARSALKRTPRDRDAKGIPVPETSNVAAFPAATQPGTRNRGSGAASDACSHSRPDVETSRQEARRAYAVRLVGEAAPSPHVGHIITAIILARAVRDSRIPLRNLMDTLRSPAPLVAIQSMIRNLEDHMLQLFGASLIAGGSKWEFVDATTGYTYDDYTHREDSETRRAVHYDIFRLSRDAPDDLRRRVAKMLARGMPILAVAETPDEVPDSLLMVADTKLTILRINRDLVETITEALYGYDGRDALSIMPGNLPLKRLGMDDLLLAFRPGRSAEAAIRTLIALVAEHESDDRDDEGDEDPDADLYSRTHDNRATVDDNSSDQRRMKAFAAHEDRLAKSKGSQSKTSSARSKNDSGKSSRNSLRSNKSSGAEVVEPEDFSLADASAEATHDKPRLTVETLVGYGGARDWALSLKADLQDYIAGHLQWSDMSTKLLLSGPPGTGKTTFVRALCNTLQVPLLVTSVSTWLEGGHLNDVVLKMKRTFEEARDRAPSILFIDEIDGIGQRQPSHREYADYWNTVVNKLLELLDGAVKSEGVIIVGATNLPHQIDPALRRSGRLETHIEIPKPDIDTLAGILAHHLGGDIKHLMSSTAPNWSAEQAYLSAASDDVGEGLGPDDQIPPRSDRNPKLQKRIGQ